MADWTSEYHQLITDCENRDHKLSDWERGFIDSIKSQLVGNKQPSPKQVETLENIWERVT